jgi:uncharacterized protein
MKILCCLMMWSCIYPITFAQDKSNDFDSGLFFSTDVEIKTPTGSLSGTITIPNRVPDSPMVIIVPGSGPTDRDCNSAITGLKTDSYKKLSVVLAQMGVSSLRFDKRGVGKSAGSAPPESEMRFEVYVNDLVTWIDSMRNHSIFTRMFILGHSEGSLVGMLAAQKVKVDGFISVDGPGRPADLLLRDQLKNIPESLKNESYRILDSLKTGVKTPDVNPALMSLFRPSVQAYLMSWMKYDPAKEIGKLNIPVLILHGTEDMQVPSEDAVLLSKGNPRADLLFIENMNHVLKSAGNDPKSSAEAYKNPDLPLHQDLRQVLFLFIKP